MEAKVYEKFVPRADWFELWAGRDPDYLAIREIRNLKRQGIAASYKSIDRSLTLVTATAETDAHCSYLEKRDYLEVRMRKSRLPKTKRRFPDVVQTILARPRNGTGGGIPLSRGEVAMLFLDGHAGDAPGLLDIRSQGYGEDDMWDGLTYDDVLNNTNEPPGESAFVWTKWEPLELWTEMPIANLGK